MRGMDLEVINGFMQQLAQTKNQVDTPQNVPSGAKQRKDIPLYSGLIRYFPLALMAVAELSRIGNEQHNPGKPLHWDRSKSTDELDALMRHLFDAGTIDIDKVRHSTKVAWRALANLQKELEAEIEIAKLPVGTPMQQYDPQRFA